MNKILSILFCLMIPVTISLAGCSGNNFTAGGEPDGEGVYRLSINWPDSSRELEDGRFIHPDTETIYVEITGAGIDGSISTSVSRPQTASSVNVEFNDVPAGNKVALIKCFDTLSNLLTQRKESFVIQNEQTTQSGDVTLGIAVKLDGTDVVFEPSSLTLETASEIPFQNWTESDVTITGLESSLPLNAAAMNGNGRWIFHEEVSNVSESLTIATTDGGNCNINVPPQGWVVQTIDSNGSSIGWSNDIAVDGSDNPCIAYIARVDDPYCTEIRYAHYNGASWDITNLDSQSVANYYYKSVFGLGLDSSDNAHILYQYYSTQSKGNHGELKFLEQSGASWTDDTLVVGDCFTGEKASMILTSSGTAHIAYQGRPAESFGIRYMYGTTNSWTASAVESVAPGGGHYLYDPSIAFYHNSTNVAIAARRDRRTTTGDWLTYYATPSSSPQTDVVQHGRFPHLKFDHSNKACAVHNTYENSNNALYFSRNTSGSTWTHEVIEPSASYALAGFAFDSSGNACITYKDNTGDLMFARQNGSGWDIEEIYDDGSNSRLVIDSSNNMHVSFYHDGAVKYAYHSAP